MTLEFRHLRQVDIAPIVAAFAAIGWQKPASTYDRYFAEQEAGTRVVWVAFLDGGFVGYVTLKSRSGYPDFVAAGVPEISDLNVLPRFQKQGVGSRLLDAVEAEAAKRGKLVGLGVGLSADYGAAQRLYVKRGYVPDGKGVFYQNEHPHPALLAGLDDHFVLWMVKEL